MPGTVVQGASIRQLMRGSSAGAAHIPTAHIPTAPHMSEGSGGGGGGVGSKPVNPMKPEDIQYDKDGNPILPPVRLRGGNLLGSLIARPIDQADQDKWAGQLKGAHAAELSKIQSALDTYDSALAANGGNKQAALNETLTADGHAAFMNPKVFNAVAGWHSVASGSEQYSVTPLGHGYIVLNTPDG